MVYLSRDIVIMPSYSVLVPNYNDYAIQALFWILPVDHVGIYEV